MPLLGLVSVAHAGCAVDQAVGTVIAVMLGRTAQAAAEVAVARGRFGSVWHRVVLALVVPACGER